MRLTVAVWKWNRPDGSALFSAVYVNRLRAALERHLHLDFEMACITDDAAGIDGAVRIVPLPELYRDTPRCRRRMRHFDRDFARQLGGRVLAMDLDMVIVDDITPIVRRPEPLVCWQVQHKDTFSGSFLLMTPGILHPLWERFHADPDGLPTIAWPRGVGSDQAMLNWYVREQRLAVPHWTDADGFVTFYGKGYERFEHHGMGLKRSAVPAGAKIIVLGSDDNYVLEEGRFAWAREHWGEPIQMGAPA